MVTAAHVTHAGRTYVKAWHCDSPEGARAIWVDRRAQGPTLWVVAPEGYLGPCAWPMRITMRASGRVSETAALCVSTADAAARLAGLMHAVYTLEPCGPLMAEPAEIERWRELTKEGAK